MELFISICIGIGLAASSGFRIFVPMLAANIASLTGLHHFGSGFEWLNGWTAFALLSTATVAEIAAYYIPWVDNALDHIALPVAVGAGTLLSASFISADISPVLKWGLGLVAGGGTAGIIHTGMGLLRLGSSTTTGGLANPVVSTAENGASITLATMSLLIPVIVAILVVVLVFFILRKLFGLLRMRKKSSENNKETFT